MADWVKLEDRVIGKMRGYEFLKLHEEFNKETQKTYYIYEMKDVATGNSVAFEVFSPNIRKEPQVMPNGQIQPPGEVYPGTNDFGKNAMSVGGIFGQKREDGWARAKKGLLELIERDKAIIVKQDKKKSNAAIRESERKPAKIGKGKK